MSGKLYMRFKSEMPSNEELCQNSANALLSGKSAEFLKENFSALIELLNDEIYRNYLNAQNESGQIVLENRVSEGSAGLYQDLDSFYMSIFQSRKSRAGSAFEYIIRELFRRLEYPFSEQVMVDGAKPDFVLPSEQHFRTKPLDSIIFTAKRTLRERWRQVVTEANKGYGYFLATIDDKVAPSQIEQMASHKVFLVVPKYLKQNNKNYDSSYNVLSFEDFFSRHLDPAMNRWADSFVDDLFAKKF